MTHAEALHILGLKDGATADEVRVAHRELAQMLHPDKFADNARLRERAEAQMRAINEARDVLLKGARGASGPRRGASARPYSSTAQRTRTTAEIAFEAEAWAHAAETARLTVVSQARTLRERRGGMVSMGIIAGLVALVTMRMSGVIGTFAFSIASMVCVWGIVDAVMLSNQANVLSRRAVELQRQRDEAADIARRAREL